MCREEHSRCAALHAGRIHRQSTTYTRTWGRPDHHGYGCIGIAVHTIAGDVAKLRTAGRLRALSRQVGCWDGTPFRFGMDRSCSSYYRPSMSRRNPKRWLTLRSQRPSLRISPRSTSPDPAKLVELVNQNFLDFLADALLDIVTTYRLQDVVKSLELITSHEPLTHSFAALAGGGGAGGGGSPGVLTDVWPALVVVLEFLKQHFPDLLGQRRLLDGVTCIMPNFVQSLGIPQTPAPSLPDVRVSVFAAAAVFTPIEAPAWAPSNPPAGGTTPDLPSVALSQGNPPSSDPAAGGKSAGGSLGESDGGSSGGSSEAPEVVNRHRRPRGPNSDNETSRSQWHSPVVTARCDPSRKIAHAERIGQRTGAASN